MFRVYFVTEMAQVKLRSGRVYAPASLSLTAVYAAAACCSAAAAAAALDSAARSLVHISAQSVRAAVASAQQQGHRKQAIKPIGA